jgi:phosphate transport system substrate-binding protein
LSGIGNRNAVNTAPILAKDAFNGGSGTSAKGNENTSEAVKNTKGAISYDEWSYAMKQHLDVAGFKTAGGVVHIGNN